MVPSDERLVLSSRDPACDLDRDPGRVATLLTVPLTESTKSSMLYCSKTRGSIVASSGRRAGIEPVMIHRPASATDQLKYWTSVSVERVRFRAAPRIVD